jgi:signal transduction histidine kinase
VASRRLVLIGAGSVALGLVAERVAFGWDDPRRWIPDLVTGWTLAACGLVAWSRRSDSRVGPLLAVTGLTWFAGNLAAAGVAAIAWAAAHAIYLYRGPLVHTLVGYPRGRVSSATDRVAVATGYVTGAVVSIWANDPATIVLASLLVLVAARGYVRSAGEMRRAHRLSLSATAVLAAALAGEAAVRLAAPSAQTNDLTLLALEAALCLIALTLLAGLLTGGWQGASVTDLVVELGEAGPATLRDELARALADPTLEIGYRLPGSDRYADGAGRPLSLPPSGSSRALTTVERDGEPVAVLIHDRGVLDDPGLAGAVAAAARLSASNARLRAEVREQAAEVRRSRLRILEAGDEERRMLERRLRDGAEERLLELRETLAQARAATHNGPAREQLDRAGAQLERTLDELRELAHGLHPRDVIELGLPGALTALADRASVPVRVAVADRPLPPELASAAWFVCSESLANVEKYAGATAVSLTVAVDDGVVRIRVEDDGQGGADPSLGSGLRGLGDRIEALGGTLELASPPGGGTRVAAVLPLTAGSADLPPGPAAPERAIEDVAEAEEAELAAAERPRGVEHHGGG